MGQPPGVARGLDLTATFDVPSRADWEAAAVKLLKGRPLEKLTTQLPEGFACPPLFMAEDAPDLPDALPDQAPYLRGSGVLDRRAAGWDVRTCVDAGTVALAAEQVEAARRGGARSIWLVPDGAGRGLSGMGGVALRGERDLDAVLADVPLAEVPVHITPGKEGRAWWEAFVALADARGVPRDQLTGAVPVDVLGDLVEGADAGGVDAAFDDLTSLLRDADDTPWVQLVGVSTLPWANRGAHAVLELTGLLASGAETLRRLDARGHDIAAVAPRVLLQVTAGRDTFTEIAKLRAVRWLWSKLVAAFGGDASAQRSFVHAVTSPSLVARIDPWSNLLRQTHGAFCAAVAGADAITMLPWDRGLGTPEAHAQRIAATSQAVLEAEAHLSQVADPAAGSWYVDWLTDQFARRAWAAFQEIESRGGLTEAWVDGHITSWLSASQASAEQSIASRKQPVVGVSTFPAADGDLRRHPASFDVPFREAAGWEDLRGRVERAVPRPSIFLANLGPLAAHTARADFARQLFMAGGFTVVDGEGSLDVAALVRAYEDSECSGVCICGTDGDQQRVVADLLPALTAAGARTRVLAGRPPKDLADSWTQAGLTHAVHLGADVLGVLTDVAAGLGVTA